MGSDREGGARDASRFRLLQLHGCAIYWDKELWKGSASC